MPSYRCYDDPMTRDDGDDDDDYGDDDGDVDSMDNVVYSSDLFFHPQ